MPLKVFNVDETPPAGFGYLSSTQDQDVVVKAGVIVASLTDDGIRLSSTDHNVYVAGAVVGDASGVSLGSSGLTSFNNTLHVARGGLVAGDLRAVDLNGRGSIVNHGEILSGSGFGTGIQVDLAGNQGAVIHNHGTIASGGYAVATSGGTESRVTLFNDGLIQGAGGNAYLGSGGVDRIVNAGVIRGTLDLGGGNDVYDGRGGRVDGENSFGGAAEVLGGAGNDQFFAGHDADTFIGGEGSDTVLFRGTGAAVTPSLNTNEGTGAASDDT